MSARLADTLDWLRQSSALRKLSANAGWLMIERVLNLVVNLGVSIWLARYLGASGFGILNYAMAFVALLGFLPYLGLDALVTRRLVEERDAAGELLGTTFALRLMGGLTAALLPISYALFGPGDPLTRLMIAIIAVGMIFDAANVIDLWFQSRMESLYTAQARAFAVMSGAVIKIGLILAEAPLVWFAVAVAGQQALQALALYGIYRRRRRFLGWTWSATRARSLLSRSWPLILASAGGLIYLKIDQLMLGLMVGNAEVGIYSVAARLSEVWWFIPTAVGASLLPVLVERRNSGQERYQGSLQRAYDLMAWGGIALAIGVTVVAEPATRLLYGVEYAQAGQILQIHIWTCPIMFMSAVQSRWLIMEDLQMFALTRNLMGATVNVAANFLLIPIYGGVGAAVATLLSYSAAVYLASFTNRRTLPSGKMMTRALFAPVRLLTKA